MEIICSKCKHRNDPSDDGPCKECVAGEKPDGRIEASGFEPEDVVNHPSHYCREGAMECIDEMVLIFGRRAVMDFCMCNAWKYRYRAADKNGEEDLKKADWYLRKYEELQEKLVHQRLERTHYHADV